MYIQRHWIFDEFARCYPGFIPSIFVQEQMLDRIKYRPEWRACCEWWALNHYKPQSIGKLMDYYTKEVATKTLMHVGKSDYQQDEPYEIPAEIVEMQKRWAN